MVCPRSMKIEGTIRDSVQCWDKWDVGPRRHSAIRIDSVYVVQRSLVVRDAGSLVSKKGGGCANRRKSDRSPVESTVVRIGWPHLSSVE